MEKADHVVGQFPGLPVTRLQELLSKGRPLILAPHPDDESLGCGGLIAQACAAGLPPVVVILTDGAASHPGSRSYPPKRLRALRREEASNAMAMLGLPAEYLVFLSYSDTALPYEGEVFATIVKQLCKLARVEGCRTVIAPWMDDRHCDHQAAAKIAASLAVILEAAILSYPLWGWLLPPDEMILAAPKMGWRLPIDRELPLKRRAIAAHVSQYGSLITDADGFQLPAALLDVCHRPYEVFLST